MSSARVFFVNDSSANPNWGCRATSYTLKRLIKEAGGELTSILPLADLAHPNWHMTQSKEAFIRRANKLTKRSGFIDKASQAVLNRVITKLPDAAPQNWAEFESKAKDIKSGKVFPQLGESLETCDLVLINGEGGILENQRESRMMFFVAYLAKKHYAKPVAMVSHTAELSHSNLNEIARNVYPLMDDIVFRDDLSLEACQSFCEGRVAADVTFSYEPAPFVHWSELAKREGYFDIEPEEGNVFDASKPFICVGGSSMFSTRHKHAYDPQDALKKLCIKLQDIAQVVLTTSAKPDVALFKPIAQSLNLPLIPLATSPVQAVDLLGNASVYVGGRWHGGIFALTGGTPVVSFAAETFKQHALMQSFGLHEPVDALNLEENIDAIVELTKDYLEQGQPLRNKLKEKARVLKATTAEHVKLIQDYGQP